MNHHLRSLLKSITSILTDEDLKKFGPVEYARRKNVLLRETFRQYREVTGRDGLEDIAAISKNASDTPPLTPFWDSPSGHMFSRYTNGAGPVSARVRGRYEEISRANPHAGSEDCFAACWNELSDDERDALRQEEADAVLEQEAAALERTNETEAERHARITATEKTMTTREQMVGDLSKHGPVAVAKAVLDSEAPGLTEQELYSIVKAHALRDKRAGETDSQAAARCFEANTEEGRVIRQAHYRAKRFFQLPTQTAHSAYDELNVLGGELRKKDPGLTREQAFAKAYSDPANADLVSRSRALTAA
jgi:hypothetical protein